ncbi:MAG: hypothetical protein A3E87_02310 [Gammaproteobacteria bacterium RIFCSPHIGHO2_12_FULL_35_23]|nr:MAG: hypothetical protein A3E87_02310 [Gammaproteobacteria bacterium RIFCSPHIGHO2_12_FULL_35_23]
MAPLWIVAGLFVVVLIGWYFFKRPILSAFTTFKLLEINLLMTGLPTSSLHLAKQIIITNDPVNLTEQQLFFIANTVGNYLAIPVAIILLIFTFLLFRKSIGVRFRRIYTMKSLLKFENSNWPQTSPILDLDLITEDINKGPWAMAMTPMQFAKAHQLIKVQKQTVQEGMLAKDIKLEAILIKPKALQLFTRQVGPMWQGVDALNMHTKALYAAFAARTGNDVIGARHLLMQIAASSKTKKLDFTGVKELLEKHRNNKAVLAITEQHAFVLTVMASMLELARSVGVQASADFLWLKPIDRRVWFMLNAVGRQTPTVEIAGPFAHWLVEKRLQRKIVTPMVEEAVKAFDEALKEVIYKPD